MKEANAGERVWLSTSGFLLAYWNPMGVVRIVAENQTFWKNNHHERCVFNFGAGWLFLVLLSFIDLHLSYLPLSTSKRDANGRHVGEILPPRSRERRPRIFLQAELEQCQWLGLWEWEQLRRMRLIWTTMTVKWKMEIYGIRPFQEMILFTSMVFIMTKQS